MITNKEAKILLQMRKGKLHTGVPKYSYLQAEFPEMVKNAFLTFAERQIDSSLPAIRVLVKMHNWIDAYGTSETELTHQAIDDVIYFILWHPLPQDYERLKIESPFPW